MKWNLFIKWKNTKKYYYFIYCEIYLIGELFIVLYYTLQCGVCFSGLLGRADTILFFISLFQSFSLLVSLFIGTPCNSL